MLVEDDNNLREIYEARLLAEGYEIISAKDGEEALALAVKEKPDLIISDVMMPKISGFDMLDILRSTPEIRDTKVIMMTALSQSEDKLRADKLGADRYLVKSQVTLEDVAKVAREVLNAEEDTPDINSPDQTPPAAEKKTSSTGVAAPVEPATPAEPAATPVAPPAPIAVPSEPTATPAVPPISTDPVQDSPADASTSAPDLADNTSSDPLPTAEPETPVRPLTTDTADTSVDSDDINFSSEEPVNLDTADTASTPAEPILTVNTGAGEAQTSEQESRVIEKQIEEFVGQQDAADSHAPADPDQPAASSADTAAEPQAGITVPADDIPVKPVPEETADTAASATVSADSSSQQPRTPAEQPEEAVRESTATQPETGTKTEDDESPAHKKVIAPLGTTAQGGPDLSELLAKEKQRADLAPGAEVIPPATTVIEPGGKVITPADKVTPPDTTQPGNIVHPAGSDPSSLAL